MIEITPRELNAQLNSQIESVLMMLLPGGKKRGHEWQAGSLAGNEGKSLCVNISGGKAGVWSDFATGESGGDLLDLWGAVKQIAFTDTLNQVRDHLGITLEKPKFTAKKTYKKPAKPAVKKPSSSMFEWFRKRLISKETVEKLKIAQKSGAICFPYISPDGELELCKYRAMDEKKFWSNEDPIPCLFGWQAINDNDRDVVIVEGEIDCASFFEKGIPALSIPKGAGSGEKQSWIEYEYDRLARFDSIYICMDMDKAGSEAKGEIIKRLGRDRCKIVDLHVYKDPNDVLMAGDDLQAFLDEAKTEDPEELCQLSDFHDDIMKELETDFSDVKGLVLPWFKTHHEIKLRPSETTLWAGINGHGKSCLLSHVIVDGISRNEKFCVASMELPGEAFGSQMYMQSGWQKGYKHGGELRRFVEDGVWIFNSYGTAKASRILDVFRYAKKRYGICHFVIDSLAKCGFAEDDYNGQKGFVDSLVDFALEEKIHVHIVVHIRKGKDEDAMPGKFDIKGTGAITDMVSNAFVVWRNKKKERSVSEGNSVPETDPDAILSCVKQRKTGVEPMYLLWFNKNSRQYLGHRDDPDIQYIYV